jgi:hypothetical protein
MVSRTRHKVYDKKPTGGQVLSRLGSTKDKGSSSVLRQVSIDQPGPSSFFESPGESTTNRKPQRGRPPGRKRDKLGKPNQALSGRPTTRGATLRAQKRDGSEEAALPEEKLVAPIKKDEDDSSDKQAAKRKATAEMNTHEGRAKRHFWYHTENPEYLVSTSYLSVDLISALCDSNHSCDADKKRRE